MERGFELPGLAPGFEPVREGPVFGVDLGTTNTCVAVVDGGVPKVVPTEHGRIIIDSLVSVTDNGTVLVGRDAEHRLRSHPTQTINESKRLVGAPARASSSLRCARRCSTRSARGPAARRPSTCTAGWCAWRRSQRSSW